MYRLFDLLATPDGDVSKIANLFPDVDEPTLRQAFHNCAQLLKTLCSLSGEVAEAPMAATQPKVPSLEISPSAEEILKKAERIKIYVDGTTRGNPGPSAYAFVFLDVNDNILLKDGEFIGEATNNIVEAKGIIAALKRALELGKNKVHLFSDSELLVKQITGEYKIRDPQLIKLHKQIQELIKKFISFQIIKIARAENKGADIFADKILRQALAEE